MVKYYGPRLNKSEVVNTKGHFLVGFIWEMLSSKGNDTYEIEMHTKGFSCDCPAFKRCKHITKVEEGLCYDAA